MVIPFFLWSAIYIGIAVFAHPERWTIGKIIITFIVGKAVGPLYFILVILQLLLVTPILIRWIKNRKNLLVVLLTPIYFCILYVYQWIFGKQMICYETPFFAWFIFYYIGLYLKINKIRNITKKNVLYFIIGTLFVSVIETYMLLYFNFPDGFSISQIRYSSLLYSISIIIYLYQEKPKWIERPFSSIGDHSFGIYFVHVLWIFVFQKYLLNHIGFNLLLIHILELICVLICSLLFIHIIRCILGKEKAKHYFGV